MKNLVSIALTILILLVLVLPCRTLAQEDEAEAKAKWLVAYPALNPGIIWAKRTIKEIDLTGKENSGFRFADPVDKHTTIDLFLEMQVNSGIFKIYHYETGKELSPEELKHINEWQDTILVTDPMTGEEKTEIVVNTLYWDAVKRFKVMEDWTYDAGSGRFDVRLIGIAPMIANYDQHGNVTSFKPLFWIFNK